MLIENIPNMKKNIILIVVVLWNAIVTMATTFTRGKYDDYDESHRQCSSQQVSGRCRCDYHLSFVGGNKCKDKINGCYIKTTLPGQLHTATEVAVYDFKNGTAQWDTSYSELIKDYIAENPSITSSENELRGYIIKIKLASRTVCVKFNGDAEFPLKKDRMWHHPIPSKDSFPLMKTPTNSSTTLHSKHVNSNVTTTTTISPHKDFSTTTGVLVGTTSALALVLLVIISIFLVRQKKQNANKRNAEALQAPLQTAPPEYSVPDHPSPSPQPRHREMPNHHHQDIPRYNNSTVHSFSERSFTPFVEAEYNEPEANYFHSYHNNDIYSNEPEYKELNDYSNNFHLKIPVAVYSQPEPEYKEIEIENEAVDVERTPKYMNSSTRSDKTLEEAINNLKLMNQEVSSPLEQRINPAAKPSIPQKPFHLVAPASNQTLSQKDDVDEEDPGYYDTAIDIGEQNNSILDLDEMYAQVNKPNKR